MASEPRINWDGLFESEVFLPSQSEARYKDPSGIIGCKNLMVAILNDAIEVYDRDPDSQDGNEAYRWFKNKEERFIFSFVAICRTLDLDPDWLRKKIFKKYNRPNQTNTESEEPINGEDKIAKKRLFRRDYPSHRSRMVPSRRPLK